MKKTNQKNINPSESIVVSGARVHNLKNIDISIPRNRLVVITGLSGSGKSSLAFDTIYAEGQRRYMETFSVYARQFIGNMERPDVDKISGLSPVIAIEQKTTNKNPRSTVGTITEIYDFLRLLYARIADAYSYKTGEKMIRYTEEQILKVIQKQYENKSIMILAPIVKGRKGHYQELFQQIRKQGHLKARIDGEVQDIKQGLKLDRYKTHDIEIFIDSLTVKEKHKKRIHESIKIAFRLGKDSLIILDKQSEETRHFSKQLMCPSSGISYNEPEPNTFSFNSPYGACPHCNGLGEVAVIDLKKIIPNPSLSIKNGGIAPIGEYKNNWIFSQIKAIGKEYGFTLDTPIKDLSKKALEVILHGSQEVFHIKNDYIGVTSTYNMQFEGIVRFLEEQQENSQSSNIKKWVSKYISHLTCPECNGSRLQLEARHFKVHDKNIAELAYMNLLDLQKWIADLSAHLNEKQKQISSEIIREISNRIGFLVDVGISYLNLNRSSRSLSGGESQRIRLATQIGTQLTNVLYILDEPSIGLHQKDNHRLIESLQRLRDIGNSVIVVEHDKDTILASDHVVDIGPGAGEHGGYICAQGNVSDIKKSNTITAQYLNGKKSIPIPAKRRKATGKQLKLNGASGHNLKNVDACFPLRMLICVTGVSGSGKSSLINETLYPILNRHFFRAEKKPLPYQSIEGIENIDKVIEIDQSPIGRTPRSNPATYTGVFDEIRKLFHKLPESQIRGYKPGRFSFNVKGGRCESCKGAGTKLIEMNFLPDVYVHCETCHGKRYNRETLEIRYRGKSINDVLEMTIEHAIEFFENIPRIKNKLKTLADVGLGYIKLGQASTTLSGGEAQRVKLASELSKRDTGNTFYILDEPTTGLHFEDVKVLLEVLQKLCNKGNTILIIEHNMEVIKVSDYIIDIGPKGGNLGGKIIATGTPEEVAQNKNSFTGEYLKKELEI